jgi:hypothetical protein
LGGKQLPDVKEFIEALLQGEALTSNSDYSAAFLGVPPVDGSIAEDEIKDNISAPSSPKDNLRAPSSLKEETTTVDPGRERKNSTIVEDVLLVAVVCYALMGIVFVLLKRRRQYFKDVELMKNQSRLRKVS